MLKKCHCGSYFSGYENGPDQCKSCRPNTPKPKRDRSEYLREWGAKRRRDIRKMFLSKIKNCETLTFDDVIRYKTMLYERNKSDDLDPNEWRKQRKKILNSVRFKLVKEVGK